MSRYRPLNPLELGLGEPAARPTRQSHWGAHISMETVGYDAAFITPARPDPPIVAQARTIIAAILAESDPDLADIQRCLREKVADHPGLPQRALLAHLLETRRRANSLS